MATSSPTRSSSCCSASTASRPRRSPTSAARRLPHGLRRLRRAPVQLRQGDHAFPGALARRRRLAYVSYRSGHPNVVVRGLRRPHRRWDAVPGDDLFAGASRRPVSSPSAQQGRRGDGDLRGRRRRRGARRLTQTRNAVSISPRWNPKTGRELAFISDRGGSPQVYVMDASGANQRPLLSLGGSGLARVVARRPFHRLTWNGGRGTFDIYLADVASGPVHATDGQGRDESPASSPDSRHLAFQSNHTGRSGISAHAHRTAAAAPADPRAAALALLGQVISNVRFQRWMDLR